ncbi:MAG TPA: cation:proton antiporter [Gammaproteobacteria bacterium]|jgi:CPA2 family monovalent cation:H+ antiporter-2|nr:cation:proton antiporter [Gammaproteobacteria bacterium]
MHAIQFIQDLAIVMLFAGLISVLFHRLKQPVVLGYIIAGVIIGPSTPPFSFIHDQETINTLAQLGVVFLMFSLGLEFSIRSLSKVGLVATFTALSEIILMIWLGYEIGHYFGWRTIDAIFLGAILAISSTTIIVKALQELGYKKEEFVQLIYGVLIVEDVLAIAIIGILSSIALSGSVNVADVVFTLGELTIFIVVTLVAGILIIPKIISYVTNFKNEEILLITVLALCFGFCLFVIKLEYSVALGAFIIGAIIAETKQLKKISRLIEPIRDMFSAIFFVSIGLLLDPAVVVKYILPIAVITIAVIFGKIISCSLGTLLAGKDGKTSLRVGMGLAQIGEFSFIIASLGISLKVTSHFLFPVAVAVSVITTFLTPYLIRFSDPLADYIAKWLPPGVANVFNLYSNWMQLIRPETKAQKIRQVVRVGLLQICINVAVVAAIFWGGSYLVYVFISQFWLKTIPIDIQKTVIWFLLCIVALPFLIAIYRKVKGLSMLLAEVTINPEKNNTYTHSVRGIISEVIPAVAIMIILFIIILLSTSILPPPQLFLLVLLITLLLLVFLRRWFIKIHAKLQIALLEVMDKNQK